MFSIFWITIVSPKLKKYLMSHSHSQNEKYKIKFKLLRYLSFSKLQKLRNQSFFIKTDLIPKNVLNVLKQLHKTISKCFWLHYASFGNRKLWVWAKNFFALETLSSSHVLMFDFTLNWTLRSSSHFLNIHFSPSRDIFSSIEKNCRDTVF